MTQFKGERKKEREKEMDYLEVNVQGLTEAIVNVFPFKVNWSKVELLTQEEGLCKMLQIDFLKGIQH